jgi:hypothetical protein
MRLVNLAVLLLCSTGFAQRAQGHFLFTRICPPAEAGRAAEVYFSEYATAGDPRFIDKVATAEFTIQTAAGQSRPLPMRRLSDRLRGHVPVSGAMQVAGALDYGALDRPGAPTFLLRHYSKAVAGSSDEVNAFTPTGTPLELLASFQPDQIVLTALHNGQPLADTQIDTVDADLAGEQLKTDDSGKVTFKPSGTGTYCIYVGHTLPTPGEHRGKAYKEIRQFATLTFSWPLAPQEPDAEAVALFEEALAQRASWADFPGFTADVVGDIEGRPFSGTVAVAADGICEIDLGEEAALAEWVDDQLESITMHRAADQASGSNKSPKPIVRFADNQADHPLGRLLAFEGGHFATSYRVKDKQLTTVNRLLDGQNMTITVLDNEKNAEGKLLPHTYAVQYWDEASGQPVRTETVRDRWLRLGVWDLPAEHTVTAASADGFCVRNFRLSKHQLAEPSKR